VSETNTGSDPNNADSDGDGLSDGEEIATGTNPNDPNDPPPPPFSDTLVGHWTFEPGEELSDRTGNFADLVLEGDAQVADGCLDLNGAGTASTGWAHANALPASSPLADKTLVSWITMQGLEAVAKSGAALSIDLTNGDRFDGIVYAERSVNRWMNGSSGFQRSPPEQFDQPNAVETETGNVIQLAITYEDLGGGQVQITGYRDGIQMGTYSSAAFATWAAGEYEALFGPRHTNPNPNGALDALVHEARLYASTATAGDILDLFNAGMVGGETLQLTDIQYDQAAGEVTIEWVSKVGATYSLEWSPDLGVTVPPGWIQEDDGYPTGGATSDRTSFIFRNIPAGAAERYFRVAEE
jgi:hypothetical protein